MRQPSLGKQLVCFVAIKALLIYTLWFLCFSHPLSKTLTPNDFADVVYGNTISIGASYDK